MIYTLCPRTHIGAFTQKFQIECTNEEFVMSVAKHLFFDKSVVRVEIYEDRVPKGDCWGKPVIVVNRPKDDDFQSTH